MKKIIGFIICTLLITTTGFSVVGIDENIDRPNKSHLSDIYEVTKPLDEVDEWPMVNHDLKHTGYSTCSVPDLDEPCWTFESGGEIRYSPSVADGKLYVGAAYDKIYCLNAYTGEMIWNYTIGNSHLITSPAVSDGKVFVGLARLENNVLCFDADSGDLVWNYTSDGSVQSSPAVYDGKVYVGSRSNLIYCLDIDRGEEIWKYTTGDDITSSPAIFGGNVYFGSLDDNFYCLNALSGDLVWSHTASSNVVFDPAIYGGNVYFGDYQYIYCLDAVSGDFEWSKILAGYPIRDVSVAYGNIYFSENIDFWLYCLDAVSGDVVWQRQFEDGVNKPAIADEKLYVLVNDTFYCLDSFTGDTLFEYPVTGGWMSGGDPCICYERVYIGDEVGNLYCFGNCNYPPLIPSKPNGPIEGFVDIEYTFTSNTTDSEGDGIYYLFDWGDGNDSGWIGPYNSGVIVNASYSWKYFGEYNVKVKAKDDNYGGESSWSEPLIINITTLPPDAPSIDGPTSGKQGVKYKFTFNSEDPEGDEVYYYIKWGDGCEEEWNGPHPSGEDFVIAHSFPGKKTFTIEAKAKDNYGAESNWTEFPITIPKHKPFNSNFYFLEWLFERFPNAFQILRQLLGLYN